MVAVEHLKNNLSLVIMQLGNVERRKAMMQVNGMIVTPLINEKVGIFFHRDICYRRKILVENIPPETAFSGTPAEAIKLIHSESSRYGYACRPSAVGGLTRIIEANEAANLAFVAPTKVVSFITDGALFNEFYAVKEDEGLLTELKKTLAEYSTPAMIDAMIADLQK